MLHIGIRVGELPRAGLLAGSVPLMAHTVAGPSMSTVTATTGISPTTPLTQLVPSTDHPRSTLSAIVVSRSIPPVPIKLASKIWQGEFVEIECLLPARLGAPEPTLGDLVTGEKQQKDKRGITSIQEWVTCFNTYMSVLAARKPDRLQDLLAYSSLIVKASMDFEGDSWLTYDKFFRRQAAAEPARYQTWGEVEPSMWTQHFGRAVAKPLCKECGESGHRSCKKGETTKAGASYNRFKPYKPPTAMPPTCRRWNRGDKCSPDTCSFQHLCAQCLRDHRVQDCPQLKSKGKRARGSDAEEGPKEEPPKKRF